MNKDNVNKKNSFVSIYDVIDGVAEVMYRKGYKEIVTYDEIMEYALEEKKNNSRIVAFVISVKKNYDPQNENDKLIIVQGLLDGNNKPISLDGREAESRIIHARTIDKKFIDELNGVETKIVRL